MTGAVRDVDRALEERPRVGALAVAMWNEARSRELVDELAPMGVPVLLLKGPDLQRRLYGTPAAYPSGDVDVLIPRRSWASVRRSMASNGWTFERENGVLWFLSKAATYERGGFRADVHWGIHAAHLPAWSLRRLEDALWDHATRGEDGALRPSVEALYVFLAVHAVGHRFERQEWLDNVRRCGDQVEDWPTVWRIAHRARVANAVRSAMGPHDAGDVVPLLDGWQGRFTSLATFVGRGHVIPRGARDRVRVAVGDVRARLGRVPASHRVRFGDVEIEVARGVFEPAAFSAIASEIADQLLEHDPLIILDVGTGSGALAVVAGRRWPGSRVLAIDTSTSAVACARRNAARLAPNVQVERGWLLDPVPRDYFGRVELMLSNIPYVSSARGRDLGDWHPPVGTVFGDGPDGLGLMRQLAWRARDVLKPGALWVFQLADGQWEEWARELRHLGFEPIDPARRRTGQALIAAAWWRP